MDPSHFYPASQWAKMGIELTIDKVGGSEMKIKTLGIDLAKSVFHLYGVDAHGKAHMKKRLSRKKLLEFMVNLPPCLVGMEACGGAHYWARTFREQGHEVKLLPPQYVKPYVKTNKNDYNDAEAICEAMSRPNMRFVGIKSVDQQDIQGLHRIRSGFMQARTRVVNQARGLLAEYGIVVGRQVGRLRRRLPEILEDSENGLTAFGRELFAGLYLELVHLDERIQVCDKRIDRVLKENEACQRLAEVEGIGPITATALVASVGDPGVFRKGRQMSAWLGLVPRQHSTGGKTVLLGISKRGDRYLRTLLIHGARSVVSRAEGKTDARSRWITQLRQRVGMNKACVALANKNARVAWALLATRDHYQVAA
jgi:transposase